MAISLVDSHCHIPMLSDNLTLKTVLENAADLGVNHFLCVSVDIEDYSILSKLALDYSNIYASTGLHPNSKTDKEPTVEDLLSLGKADEIIAIGETGLDYFRSEGDLEWQRERLRTHIHAAKQLGKPLIIHSREARGDVVKILKEEGADQIGGVMHCFVDDWETAQRAMDLGFYISFSGIVTFKNAELVQAVAKQVPLNRLLIETDSPYLTPVPYRGKENQPAYVRYVAEFLSELRGEPLETIAEHTTRNFFNLFKI